ncbi:MFS transporter [Maribellus comscasis]|uniref:MFS transporter n=1 Tax=Maribellus comscasis TaxID=2681766 RepID=A0A6I6K0J8_9BACT|nr:MFS transporter [Maribellus comscasis]QGY47119.1 MFS transporter [Maribellus comscasis]
MTGIALGNMELAIDKKRARLAVSLVYFCMGLAFASWASRIPDIKTTLQLSDGVFGSILFALPVGQFLMMPFSGKLVTRFGSHNVLKFALPAYTFALSGIGLVQAGWQLAGVLFLFGIFGNMCNISVNTQGVAAERLYGRPIMASFHGGWSLAGFTGALIGLVMVNLKVAPFWHFVVIILIVWGIVKINYPYLLRSEAHKGKNEPRRKFFMKPDGILLQLGIIGFFSMASEGAMFDWSGVYFKDVVKAPDSLVILGYTSFMIMMATGRFLADYLISKIGRKRLMRICGIMISGGLFTSVIFPYLIPSTIAFMMVGLGVSSIVPTVYSTAGKQHKIPPGIALATVSSVSFLGFLMGPPLIGFIAEAFGLRYSYAVIGVFGIGITLLVAKVKALQSEG